jgi:ABC-type dipeptide/oligopeptide/nickel transport system ATPase component
VTSALDQLVAEGILKLLDRLQKELNLAYMFITHDLATVRSIADEVVVMQHGKVVEQGPKDEMFTPPHHPYTDLLLSSVPGDGSRLADHVLEERGVDNVGDLCFGTAGWHENLEADCPFHPARGCRVLRMGLFLSRRGRCAVALWD